METYNIGRGSESTASTHAAPNNSNIACLSGTGSRTDGDEYSPVPNVNNVIHQRRRVNPESLALRLGPDLVRDLDALITPGNTEMPSFAVRKELQERYDIDRRHIYDYFHSRGLRVVKEDKHGNPITAKDLPTPLPNLRPLRQAPIKSNSRSHTSSLYPVSADRKLFKPRGVTKAKPGRPRKNPAVNPKIVTVTCETNEPKGSADIIDSPPSEHSSDAVPKAAYIAVNPLLPHAPLHSADVNCAFDSVVNPLDESFSVRRAVGDIAYAYRHKLVFERMQELIEYPVRPDDRSLSWNVTSPCAASDKGLLVPHAKPLTRDERKAIYESISVSIGPPNGIQECQGTYRKHMQARTKLYFEGILSGPCHTPQQPTRTSTSSERKPPLGTNEFRYWLSETRLLKSDGGNGPPWLHGHQNANAAKRQEMDGTTDNQNRQISIPNGIQPLDDLFPVLGRNLNSGDTITDSPVLHTRPATAATQIMAQPRVDADRWSAGVAETLQTNQAQLHGLSGFPGTQEANLTRVSFAELDHQLHWPEHVPYAASSGRRYALSDTQGRVRNMSNPARVRHSSHSPCKHHIRDLDRIWTRPVTSRDARRRTPSGAGGI